MLTLLYSVRVDGKWDSAIYIYLVKTEIQMVIFLPTEKMVYKS